MLDIPLLGWISRTAAQIFGAIWRSLKIKDGSAISLNSIGDKDDSHPEMLIIGINGDTALISLIRIPLIVSNKGLAAVRNLSVSVQIPRKLSANISIQSQNPAATFYQTDYDQSSVLLDFQLTSMRIDESIVVPISLRIGQADWICVKAGGPPKYKRDLALIDFREGKSSTLVAIRINVAVHADNIRAVKRSWDLIITPSKNLRMLRDQDIHHVIAIQRIWSGRGNSFNLPILGSLVFMSPFPKGFQSVALVHTTSDRTDPKPEMVRHFDLRPEDSFVLGKIHRKLAVNPGNNRRHFIKWRKTIKDAKPDYYP